MSTPHPHPPRILPALVAGLLLLALPGTAPADTVVLTNGRSLEGRAVVLDNGDVELWSSMGMIRLPAHKVSRVRSEATIEDRIAERLEALSEITAEDLWDAGEEARLAGASTLSRKLFREAIRLDPDHEATRRALGYVSTEDGWRLATDVAAAGPGREQRGQELAQREQAERIALLRALRAQADATRRAEEQRRIAHAGEVERPATPSDGDDFVVRTVVPIATAWPATAWPIVPGHPRQHVRQRPAPAAATSPSAPDRARQPAPPRRSNRMVRAAPP